MKQLITLFTAALITFTAASQSTGRITTTATPGAFPLVSHTTGATAIYVDPKDYWLVHKAASLLQDDIEKVTTIRPELLDHLDPSHPIANLIIIGSLDSSALITRLKQQHKLATTTLQGKWEVFSWQTLDHPLPGVGRAFVITGSDRRGTAFGVFELSGRLGISPWYWWADVPVKKKKEAFVSGLPYQSTSPAVKYRGFFINDEAPALSGWVKEKFGTLNHVFYEKVFELLLRLKANYLWPAMWGNAFNDDDTLNPVLADQYGIVMGTSHHEPMLRAQQEWKRYGHGPWNYETNAPVLDSFWRKGIEHMDHHESIVTVGMRGDGDMPMQQGSNIALLEKIVADQRNILHQVTGKDPASIPQSWALYKEVQDYYDKGMRVPDDVTLLLCDDNWGNVRKLPQHGEKPRTGGYGMYYHFDYVGGPRNYKWLNTNLLDRVWEQMNLTLSYGVNNIWIVNVGDIKPMEFPIEFFLDYAWHPDPNLPASLPEYTRRWATRQFGPDHADEIAHILTLYTKYNSRRKPELLSPDTYSLLNYNEAERITTDYNDLASRAEAIYRQLPSEYRDAYYQLVLYPVLACANLNELYVTTARNRLYASQGRIATNGLARRAQELYNRDSALSLYYNKEMAGGKWDHMMDQTHIGYTYWQQPLHNSMPRVKTLDSSKTAAPATSGSSSGPSAASTFASGPSNSSWGLAVEGSSTWWPAAQDSAAATLPVSSPLDPTPHYFEIFNRTSTPFSCRITASMPWIHVPGQMTINQEERIRINIDWQQVPKGPGQAPPTITVTAPGGNPITLTVPINNPTFPHSPVKGSFIGSGGALSIEAEHFSRAVETSAIKWKVIPNLGRTLSGVEASPVTAPAQTPGGNSPHLEYPLYLFDTGVVDVQVYLSPILEFNRKTLHYAISFDDAQPQVIDCSTGNEAQGTWDKMVSDNIRIIKSPYHITRPGQHVLKFWMVDPAIVLQKIVVDAGGVRPSYLGPLESYRWQAPRTDAGKGLKDYYKDYFPIGVAVNGRSISGPDTTLILQQFNSVTPENAMKMGPIHPEEDRYNWKEADAIVDFAQKHHLRVRGHNLCWHEQTPAWLFKDASGGEVSKTVLLQRLKDHITTVVNRYKGKIYAWDVVNEAIDDDSTKFLRNSEWYRICGEEFIARAFEYAHAADPHAQLFYNDYNTERPEKRERVYQLLKRLVDAHVPITGVGIQAHWSIYEPTEKDLQTTIERFSSLGLKVQVTELDISIYPWEKDRRPRRPGESDLFTPERERMQVEQYKNVFAIFRKYRNVIGGVTFWNVTDRYTWLDGYPVPGRKNYPLLFDTNGQPKKAYWEVIPPSTGK